MLALDPFYDSYRAGAAFAGARLRRRPAAAAGVALRRRRELAAAVTARTRVLLLNTPHNPTGRVLDRDELEAIARVCIEHDLVAISDEVYEHLVFDGEHVPIATLPGMAERTLTVSSIGKTFSVTGWKIGLGVRAGRARRRDARRQAVHDVRGRHAAAARGGGRARHGRGARRGAGRASWPPSATGCAAGLERAGAEVLRPAGTYFVNADVRPLGYDDGVAFCRELPERAGVVAIPTSVFSGRPRAASGRSCASRSASARRSSTRRRRGWDGCDPAE